MRRQPSARAVPAAVHASDECYTRRTCSVAAFPGGWASARAAGIKMQYGTQAWAMRSSCIMCRPHVRPCFVCCPAWSDDNHSGAAPHLSAVSAAVRLVAGHCAQHGSSTGNGANAERAPNQDTYCDRHKDTSGVFTSEALRIVSPRGYVSCPHLSSYR